MLVKLGESLNSESVPPGEFAIHLHDEVIKLLLELPIVEVCLCLLFFYYLFFCAQQEIYGVISFLNRSIYLLHQRIILLVNLDSKIGGQLLRIR